jgi:hypothetical protein
VRLLHAWALESPRLTAYAVDLAALPHLASALEVRTVPQVRLSGRAGWEVFSGPTPEPVLLERLRRAGGAD